jgi:homopolymeric O-antigen transport system permease protein
MPRAAETLPAGGQVLVDRAADGPSIRRTLAALHRYRHLLRNLVLKDLKLKYRGSVIGFLWSLANPLLMAAVYTFAFTRILGQPSEGFVFYLMLGLLAWTYFASSASMSTGAIVDSGGLVKSVWFPRAILPVATVLFNLAQYLLSVLVILPLMLAWYQVTPSAPMLLFPIFVALQTLFTAGVAMTLATGAAFLRDVRHFVEIALTVLFWMTPIIYDARTLDEPYRSILPLGPVAPYVSAYQEIFYFQRWPDAAIWATTIGYAVIMVAIGLWLIVRHEDRFAEQV